MDNELDPRLQEMLKSYGATTERDPDSARRTEKRFKELLNLIFEEQVGVGQSVERNLSWASWVNYLRGSFALRRRSLLFGFAALTVLALFLFGGMGITAFAASSSLPGDSLYLFKTTIENVRAGWTPDAASKARLYMEFAGRRLSEIQSLMDSNRYEDIPRATNEFENDIQRAMNAAERVSKADPARATALNAELAVALRVYRDILNAWIATTPVDSHVSLRRAADVSQSAADVLAGRDGNADNLDDSFDDEDDVTLVPSQTQLVASTPGILPDASQTLQAASTSELLPAATQPPPATLTSVPVVIPTNTSAGSGSVAPGQDATCNGSIGTVHVANLIVPQGASCTLIGTRIDGSIVVEIDASLTAQQVSVTGNVQAQGASYVGVFGSTVGASVQIKQGGSASIEGASVNGDIQLESNYGVLSASGNQVGGNIQVFKNSAGITIANNSVMGNLQCKENNSAPTGGNNTVQGNKEEQCSNL